MAFNSKVHCIEGVNYRFSNGDMYWQNNKGTWFEADHVYNKRYKAIADKIVTNETTNSKEG